MDEQRTPPPTPTDLLRLVAARIISVDEARRFLYGEERPQAEESDEEKARAREAHYRHYNGKHARLPGRIVL
jgi:hypothetical protein